MVKKAIYGLKKAPLFWSSERHKKLSKMIIDMPMKEDPSINEEYILKKLQSDPTTWHILKEGNEEESKGLLLTYIC